MIRASRRDEMNERARRNFALRHVASTIIAENYQRLRNICAEAVLIAMALSEYNLSKAKPDIVLAD